MVLFCLCFLYGDFVGLSVYNNIPAPSQLRIWDDAKRKAVLQNFHFGHVFGSRMLMLECDLNQKGFWFCSSGNRDKKNPILAIHPDFPSYIYIYPVHPKTDFLIIHPSQSLYFYSCLALLGYKSFIGVPFLLVGYIFIHWLLEHISFRSVSRVGTLLKNSPTASHNNIPHVYPKLAARLTDYFMFENYSWKPVIWFPWHDVPKLVNKSLVFRWSSLRGRDSDWDDWDDNIASSPLRLYPYMEWWAKWGKGTHQSRGIQSLCFDHGKHTSHMVVGW